MKKKRLCLKCDKTIFTDSEYRLCYVCRKTVNKPTINPNYRYGIGHGNKQIAKGINDESIDEDNK